MYLNKNPDIKISSMFFVMMMMVCACVCVCVYVCVCVCVCVYFALWCVVTVFFYPILIEEYVFI